MIDMVRRDILPAISKFTGKLAESGKIKREFCPSADTEYESKTVERLSALATEIMKQTDRLDRDVEELFTNASDIVAIAKEYRTRVFAGMEKLRGFVDEAETLTDTAAWPYPTYGDLMFSVK
jgi:glutamine synthetase